MQLIKVESNCPLCNSESKFLYEIPADFIEKNLAAYYGESCPNNLVLIDYTIFQCKRCSLQYAFPLKPGSSPFYEYVSSHSAYYPVVRWEWAVVIDKINKSLEETAVSLLEIGCGNGLFLEMTKQVPQLRAIGLDTTISSIEKCREKGLETYPESIESFLSNINKRDFHYIVAFHCLEHVIDPKEFVSSVLMLLKPSGKIYLSTPYSPMSFEPVWFDPMNHPPHHLTRWNEASYRELARQLNLNIAFYMPDAAGIIDRALYTLNLLWNGPMDLSSNIGIKTSALMHPFVTCKEIVRQKKRSKVNNQVAANVVLVEMWRDNN